MTNSFARLGRTLLATEHRALLNAIRQVESGAEDNEGLGAVGDEGDSLGPYQIQKAYWIDATDKDPSLKQGHSYEDVLNDHEYSERIILAYWSRYAITSRMPNGAQVTDEDRARIHNGGPNGHKSQSTEGYWDKVSAILN